MHRRARPSDRVFSEPHEEHWPGASADRFMPHVAVLQLDDQGVSAVWGEHVTADEIDRAPVA